MTSCLDGLPFDILFGVSLFLDVEDVVSLHNSCRQLRFLLGEETLCRRLMEDRASSTLELRDAPITGYCSALRRLYKRRTAVAAGRPASVATLGYATDAVYGEGVACFVEQDHVQILDLHGPLGPRRTAIRSLLDGLESEGAAFDYDSVRLLSYHSNVIVLHYECEDGSNWLLAVDISRPHQPRRIIEPERLRSTNKLFVRQTKDFLFYGTHSVYGSWCGHRYREWLIQGISLSGREFFLSDADGCSTRSNRSAPIQLHGFAGSEIGSTASFTVYEDYFYAVTNCDAFDVIEVDFTSFYKCIRFPIENAQQSTCQAARRIYRRQHAEGPVNDGWNSLDFKVDERTQQLLIVEGRAEWPLASGTLSRGFYAQSVDLDNQELEMVRQSGPTEDPLSKIPDDETKYCETPQLPPWHRHLEVNNTEQNLLGDVGAASPTLSRSKYRDYNFTCMASIELVEQPCGCRGIDAYCLQLRAASRIPAPLMPLQHDKLGSRKGKSKALESYNPWQNAHETDAYRYSPISLWPKEDTRLHEAMNLPAQLQGSYGVDIKAWMDERCIVYFIQSGGVGKVVCLNFDGDSPARRLPELIPYTALQPRGRSPLQQSDPEHLRKMSPERQAFEYPIFDPHEAKDAVFTSTCDLDDIPDAGQLSLKELEGWFDMLDCKHASRA